MPYATRQNMIDRFGQRDIVQLTDRADPPAGTISNTVLNKALQEASDDIDGYLSSRYALPLSPAPPVLESHCCIIARYRLYPDSPPERVRQDYEDTLRWLRDIAAGKANLPGAAGVEAPAKADQILTAGSGRVFSRDSMGGF